MASAAVANTKNASSSCFHCEGSFHQQPKGPARNVTCFSCSRWRHFANACQSKIRSDSDFLKKVTSSTLLSIAAGAPDGLEKAIVDSKIKKHDVKI